jgi:hypothetical protein
LSFFLSAERVAIRVARTSTPALQSAQRRLDRLQSVCGCIPAVIALPIGIGVGWWMGAPVYVVCMYGIGAAAFAKFATIAGSYFAYRIYLARLCRRLDTASGQALVQ